MDYFFNTDFKLNKAEFALTQLHDCQQQFFGIVNE